MATSAQIYKGPQYFHQTQLMNEAKRQKDLVSPEIKLNVNEDARDFLLKTQDSHIPKRFQEPEKWKIQPKTQHPMFTTTASSYGKMTPTIHEMPKRFHGQSSKFTENLNMAGPYRNFSLNTR